MKTKYTFGTTGFELLEKIEENKKQIRELLMESYHDIAVGKG